VTAVIAAAGSGQRLGAGGPKAFIELAGRPMVEWSIEALRGAPSIGEIVVAAPPPEGCRISFEHLEGNTTSGGGVRVRVVAGGETRAESVRNGLERVETELVAIHDAARPLLTADLVEDVIAALMADEDADGAIAAAPVGDTIKRAGREPEGGRDQGTRAAFPPDSEANAVLEGEGARDRALEIEGTVDRAQLWAAQTPQVFRLEALRRALEADPASVAAATDEAMLVVAAGGRVLIHPAPAENIKVTTPLDLRVAEFLLAERASGPQP
jgi:2-C-methyl-D-erythritol 4-phosphate cytidylyltransferase